MKVYLLSGLGGDEGPLMDLRFPHGFEREFIPWKEPFKSESFEEYLKRLAENIDDSQPFVLCGVSFGGVCAQQIQSFKPAKALILISTVTGPTEFPFSLKLGKWSGVVKHLPAGVFKWIALNSGRALGLRGKDSLRQFRKMINLLSSYYYFWCVNALIQWKGSASNSPVLRLNGNRDKLFSITKICNTQVIEKGEHLMVQLQAAELSGKIESFLTEEVRQSTV